MSGLGVIKPRERAIPVPRGPLMTAATIVREYFTEADGRAIVSNRYIRENCPNKVVLSYNRVAWYRDDVEHWIATLRQAR